MGGEAGFSAPLLAKARAAPVEMTMFGGSGRERHSGRYAPLENAGILRCAQNDDVKLTTTKATARATTKYRDLSTAAAKCAALVEMTFVLGVEREQSTARTRVGWETVYIPTLGANTPASNCARRGPRSAAPKMGHPSIFWLGQKRQ